MTAKIICNRLGLPVFVLNEKVDADDLQVFINALRQDCVLFIDEYEKTFGRDGELLTLMDGSLNLSNNILFLLTSNDMDVNENLFNRPSRVFFIKQFGGLEENEIAEILDDFLKDVSLRDEIFNTISMFEEVTIDNIMMFLEEVNYSKHRDIVEIVKHLNIKFKPQKAGFKINRL
jgi:SpoVK/Ycf46/Vps4 family AAA+-type ATPase